MARAPDRPADAHACEHGQRPGCVYCPTCGARYPVEPEPRGCLALLMAPFEFLSAVYTPASATPELDVTANLEALRSGDADRIRAALGFLLDLAAQAWPIRADIAALLDHDDRDIALRARDVVAAIDAIHER